MFPLEPLSIERAPVTAAVRPHRCFRATGHPVPIAAVEPLRLADPAAQALAELIAVLGCGEEAAAIAFTGLAASDSDPAAARALQGIADEERHHDALLAGLALRLPTASDAPKWLRAARRFHAEVGRGSMVDHLARVAAIDAAVCTVLARVTARQRPVGADPVARGIFGRIHRDEARHVRVSRRLAIDRANGRVLADIAIAARRSLADVLALGGGAFETLGVDPDALLRDIRALPPRLVCA